MGKSTCSFPWKLSTRKKTTRSTKASGDILLIKKNIVILLYQNNMQTKEVLKPLPGIIHLVHTQNFPKKITFFTPWCAHLRTRIRGGNLCKRTKWMIPYLGANFASRFSPLLDPSGRLKAHLGDWLGTHHGILHKYGNNC